MSKPYDEYLPGKGEVVPHPHTPPEPEPNSFRNGNSPTNFEKLLREVDENVGMYRSHLSPVVMDLLAAHEEVVRRIQNAQ